MSGRARAGAWHRGLDRGIVAAEALRILDEEGRDGLTMRRLATALHVEAASLYAHVRSKDDLVDAVLDAVLDGVDLPQPGPDPRAELVAAFTRYRQTIVAHPAVVTLMLERARMSASQARLITRSMELFETLGLTSRAAVDAHVTIVAYVLGFMAQEVARPVTAPASVRTASPALARALATLAERSVDERFEVGLQLILDGILAPPPAGSSRARRAKPDRA